MPERLDLTFDPRPSREAIIAAEVRQLVRAQEVRDRVAMWSAAYALRIALRGLLKDVLARESSWDSDGRWLDTISDGDFLLEPPGRCLMSGSVIWGRSEDVGGPRWAEPLEVDLAFLRSFTELVGYIIRFGDRRAFPEEGIGASIDRMRQDIASGSIEWAYVIRPAASENS